MQDTGQAKEGRVEERPNRTEERTEVEGLSLKELQAQDSGLLPDRVEMRRRRRRRPRNTSSNATTTTTTTTAECSTLLLGCGSDVDVPVTVSL